MEIDDSLAWLQRMHVLRKDTTFCDVQFQLGERTLGAHRLILAAHSKHWRQVFTDDPDTSTLEIQLDADPQAFAHVLDFCYLGKVSLGAEEMTRVHILAHQFDMPPLQTHCETLMTSTINDETCVDFYRHAVKYSLPQLPQLQEACWDRMVQRFEAVSNSAGFLRLTRAQLCEVLCLDTLGAAEEHILSAALRWLQRARVGEGLISTDILDESQHHNHSSNDKCQRDSKYVTHMAGRISAPRIFHSDGSHFGSPFAEVCNIAKQR